MPWVRLFIPTVVLACVAVAPRAAQAQPPRLDLATAAASTAAAADWASTYHGLKYYNLRESNPMLQPWQHAPGKLVSIGAAIDAASVSAWNLTIGRNHPRVATAGLWGMAAFRTYLVIHNLRNQKKYGRRPTATLKSRFQSAGQSPQAVPTP